MRPLHHLKDHRDPVDVMAWSPDGQTLVTGADKGLYLWNTKVSYRGWDRRAHARRPELRRCLARAPHLMVTKSVQYSGNQTDQSS